MTQRTRIPKQSFFRRGEMANLALPKLTYRKHSCTSCGVPYGCCGDLAVAHIARCAMFYPNSSELFPGSLYLSQTASSSVAFRTQYTLQRLLRRHLAGHHFSPLFSDPKSGLRIQHLATTCKHHPQDIAPTCARRFGAIEGRGTVQAATTDSRLGTQLRIFQATAAMNPKYAARKFNQRNGLQIS